MQNAIVTYKAVKKQWSKEERAYYLKQYSQRKGTMSEFCQRNCIPPTTFYGWVKEAKKRMKSLAEVKLEIPSHHQMITLRFPNEIELSMKVESTSEFKGVLRSILTC